MLYYNSVVCCTSQTIIIQSVIKNIKSVIMYKYNNIEKMNIIENNGNYKINVKVQMYYNNENLVLCRVY